MTVRIGTDLEIAREQPEAIRAASLGIAEVIALAGLRPVFDNHLEEKEQLIDDMLERFRQPNPAHGGKQVNAPEVAASLYWKGVVSPHRPIYLLTAKDLFAKGANFLFGANLRELGFCIQSTKRFRDVNHDPEWLKNTTQHWARHEFGHELGLNASSITYQDTRAGIYAGHCAVDPCTMNQSISIEDTGRAIYRLQNSQTAGFCGHCVGVLKDLGAQR